jgi:hypothetical protein
MKKIELTGLRFGQLVVLREAAPDARREAKWFCACDCGETCVVLSGNLRKGNTRSCGCVRKEVTAARSVKHGMSKTLMFFAWEQMKQRCYNPRNHKFKDYGARGITVCDQWRESFAAFLADMGERPPGKSIDRRENDGNYEPGNCRWATRLEQAANKRVVIR